jgi:DNA-binding NarL/FixJ family response regulator
MIRAYVADDHAIVLEGMRRLFETSGDITVVGEARDGRAVLNALETAEWDVLVLDLSLPIVSGLEVLRRVRAARPDLPVVVLSMYPEKDFGPRVLAEGAAAYVSKERPLADVESAIRAAVKSQRDGTASPLPHPPYGVSTHPQTPTGGQGLPHESLSAREYQVFMLLIEGRSNVEMAAELDLVASTVSNHLAKVKQKLGAKTVAEIVAYAHRIGLV